MPTKATNRDEEISSLLEIESEIVSLMRILASTETISYEEASNQFTNIHAHAAWTDIVPLANLAENIWSNLTHQDTKASLNIDERAEMTKNLITYKFLLSRLMHDYQPEIDAAMAS